MLRVANAAYDNSQVQLHARPIRRAYLALQCSAVVVFLTFGFTREGFAASELNCKITSSQQAIPAGQQQTGLPLKLHGVFEGFNPDTHRIKLTHLAGMEFSWGDAMRDIEVDRSVSVNALEPGMAVTAVLTRKPNGQYYVTGLGRSQPPS